MQMVLCKQSDVVVISVHLKYVCAYSVAFNL